MSSDYYNRARFWGPKIAKEWGPRVGAAIALSKIALQDHYKMVKKWAKERGLVKKHSNNSRWENVRRLDNYKRKRSPNDDPYINQRLVNRVQREPSIPRSDRTTANQPAAIIEDMADDNEVTGPLRSNNLTIKSGMYTGVIPFPKRKPKIQKDKYALYGSRGRIEHTGIINRQNVNYIGFVSMIRDPTNQNAVGSVTYHVAAALLRHILKKHFHIDVEYPMQKFEQFGPVGATATIPGIEKIDFYYKQTNQGTLATTPVPTYGVGYTLQITLTKTFFDMAKEIAENVICGKNFGARGNPGQLEESQYANRELYGYGFEERSAPIGGGVSHFVYNSPFRLDTQYVDIDSKMTCFLQNITPSDGGSNATDQVDVNPLKVRMFYFDHPNPVTRHFIGVDNTDNATPANPFRFWKLMHDRNGDGLIIPDAAITGGDANLIQIGAQMPTADMFMNCKRTDGFILAPGEIKKFGLNYKFNGTLPAFIKSLKLLPLPGPEITGTLPQYQPDIQEYSKAAGTSILFAFDRLLATGTNSVVVNYERIMSTKAILTKRKKITMLPLQQVEVTAVQDDTTTA